MADQRSASTTSGSADTSPAWQSCTGYDAWADIWDVDLSVKTADYDLDGWDNLTEYGLDGNPTNGFIDGYVPAYSLIGGALQYVHVQRNDDTNIVYYLELSDDLMVGGWANSGYTVTGTNTSLGGSFDEVTNSVPVTGSEKFIRLTIEN
jgi:hypothetical protein